MTAAWFVPLVESTDRPMRLLCMPQVGAGVATFGDLAGRLSGRLAGYGLNLPGRQARFAEPARTDLDRLVADLVGAVREFEDRPYSLVGYCSGATLAFLVARGVRAAGLRPPSALVALSFPAPQFTTTEQVLHTLPTDRFWSLIVSSGGFPERLAREPGFQAVFEPALRADYELMSGYRYNDEPPLDLPITVVAGRHDDAILPIDLYGWTAQTTAVCSLHIIDCGHWMLDGAVETVARLVEDACRTAT